MSKNIKTKMELVKDVISWIVLIVMLFSFLFVLHGTYDARKTGEGFFLFGYRPVFILSGSMEPYMMTNGIAFTKEVNDISELKLGDVVTFHINNDEGDTIYITHRIIAIDQDKIYTKGDNNNVGDGLPITMENVEAKVIAVFNQSAWLVAKWQTTAGKLLIISVAISLIALYLLFKLNFKLSTGSSGKDSVANEIGNTSDIASENLFVSNKGIEKD